MCLDSSKPMSNLQSQCNFHWQLRKIVSLRLGKRARTQPGLTSRALLLYAPGSARGTSKDVRGDSERRAFPCVSVIEWAG